MDNEFRETHDVLDKLHRKAHKCNRHARQHNLSNLAAGVSMGGLRWSERLIFVTYCADPKEIVMDLISI